MYNYFLYIILIFPSIYNFIAYGFDKNIKQYLNITLSQYITFIYDINILNTTTFLNDTINISCVDNNNNCSYWSKNNECIINPKYMLYNCKKSCDICYINSNIVKKLVDLYSRVCIDFNNTCESWSKLNECHKNPNYMLNNCRKSCNNSCNISIF